jgi:hypothetical protein
MATINVDSESSESDTQKKIRSSTKILKRTFLDIMGDQLVCSLIRSPVECVGPEVRLL